MLNIDQGNPEIPLTPLREDLSILEGPPLENGAPTWSIHDPARNTFYRIGRLEFEIISRWDLGDVGAVLDGLHAETTLTATPEDIAAIRDFLLKNMLLDPADQDACKVVHARVTVKPPHPLSWLLKNYLFFRIPVCNPDAFLGRTYPLVSMLFSHVTLIVLAMASLAALLLIEHHWESFFHTFLYFFSFEGIVFYGLTLFGVKLLHELGHAYTSKYYGLNVPSMGIAFLVMWPVLYSDNSDAWRLRSRKARMSIVAAGTIVELSLAVMATILWVFLPDGPLKSACFLVATVTWISSLLINLSPFMRFDGYYFLSDYLGVPNLAPRAFALAKWELRRFVLGLCTPPPEVFSRRKHRALIAYAWGTWLYRLFLFLGIAFMVYHFFFKALGIILLIVELSVFIFNPILREIRAWWTLRPVIGCNGHVVTSALICILLLAWLVVPLPGKIVAPAVRKARQTASLYPPFSCRITTCNVQNGGRVGQGDVLFELESPHIDHQMAISAREIETLRIALKRQKTATAGLEQSLVTFEELFRAESNLEGLSKQKKRLVITAPFAGMIKDIPPGLHAGSWVNQSQFLGTLLTPDAQKIHAYIQEKEVQNMADTSRVLFYSDSGEHDPVACTLVAMDPTSPETLEDDPSLASLYGGTLPVEQDRNHHLILKKSHYRALFLPETPEAACTTVENGHIVINRKPRSLIVDTFKHVYGVLIRESGF